jgi:hypothetical protein
MQTKDDDKLDEVKAILRRLQRIGAGDEEGAPPGPERTPLSGDSTREWTRHKIGKYPDRANGPQARPGAHVAVVAAERWLGSRLWRAGFVAVPVLLLIAGATFILWPNAVETPQPALPGKTAEFGKAQPSPTSAERPQTAAAIPQSDLPQPTAENPANPQAGAPSAVVPRPPLDQNADRISYAQHLIDEGKITAGRDLLLDGLAEQKADAALALARSYDPNSVRLIPNADAAPDIEQAERWYRRWHEIAARDGLALDSERLDRIIKAMR